jgi:hypothetical protein
MIKFLKGIGIFLAVVVLLAGIVIFGARFNDGPLEIISGGPFKSGTLAPAPDDWSFLVDRTQIEFQTIQPAASRTVWLGVHDKRLFLISGYMTTGYGALWKQWPHYIENDDRVVLRIDGKLYEQRLQRVMNGPEVAPVLSEFSRKYGDGLGTGADEVIDGHTWMYEVVEREG